MPRRLQMNFLSTEVRFSNLDDPDEIFYLNLSLRLLEQEAEKN